MRCPWREYNELFRTFKASFRATEISGVRGGSARIRKAGLREPAEPTFGHSLCDLAQRCHFADGREKAAH